MQRFAHQARHADLIRRLGVPAGLAVLGTVPCVHELLPPRFALLALLVIAASSAAAWHCVIEARVGTALYRWHEDTPVLVIRAMFLIAGGALGLFLASTILREAGGASVSRPQAPILAATLLGVAAAAPSWQAAMCFVSTLAGYAVHESGGPAALGTGLLFVTPGIGCATALAILRRQSDPPVDSNAVSVDGEAITRAIVQVLAAVDQASARFLANSTGFALSNVELALADLARRGSVERVPCGQFLARTTTWRSRSVGSDPGAVPPPET